MKLVFLSHDSNHNGGAQKCLVDLLKGLKCQYPSCEIYVVFPSEGKLIETCKPYMDGYKVISMPWWMLNDNKNVSFRKKLSFALKIIRKAINIMGYLRQIKPNYGITNTIVLPYLAVACKMMSIKHLWFVHEVPATWGDRKFVFSVKTIYKWIDSLSSTVIVPSVFAKDFYVKEVAPSKIAIINQAVDLDVEMIDSSVQGRHKRYTILLVGTFDSNKGQLELLQAVKKIVDSGEDINCYLVGADAGHLSVCEEFIASNKLENNVTIASFTDNIHLYYLLSDVLVVCSMFETFGRVAVEAQKCGLPVILSNVGANPERIQNGLNGLLYQKGDIDDLVHKIELLRDTGRRNKFIEEVKKMDLEQYSVANFASQFYELLQR